MKKILLSLLIIAATNNFLNAERNIGQHLLKSSVSCYNPSIKNACCFKVSYPASLLGGARIRFSADLYCGEVKIGYGNFSVDIRLKGSNQDGQLAQIKDEQPTTMTLECVDYKYGNCEEFANHSRIVDQVTQVALSFLN